MLAFIHIQKTAGTTLTSILRRSFGLRHLDARELRNRGRLSARQLASIRPFYPRLESLAGHGVRPFSDLETLFPHLRYYTFLREPIARTLSHFAFNVRRGALPAESLQEPRRAIREFLSDVRNRQVRHLTGADSAEEAIRMIRERVGFVGLVERFDESLLLFRRWCDHPRLDISYVPQNVSNGEPVPGQDLLKRGFREDPEVRGLVEAANQADLQLYRWAVDELYPAQQAEYGVERLEQDLAAYREENGRRRRLWLADAPFARLYRNLIVRPWVRWSGGRRAA